MPLNIFDWFVVCLYLLGTLVFVYKIKRSLATLVLVWHEETLIKSIFDNQRNLFPIAGVFYASYLMWNKNMSYLQDTNLLANILLSFGVLLLLLNVAQFFNFVVFPITDKCVISRQRQSCEKESKLPTLGTQRVLVAKTFQCWFYFLLVSFLLLVTFEVSWIVVGVKAFQTLHSNDSPSKNLVIRQNAP